VELQPNSWAVHAELAPRGERRTTGSPFGSTQPKTYLVTER
jgi:hypothetical protein